MSELSKEMQGFVRAFWRRIKPHADKFEKELPAELPVEIEWAASTAQILLQDNNATLIPVATIREIQAKAIERAAEEVRDKFSHWGIAQIWLNKYALEIRAKATSTTSDKE